GRNPSFGRYSWKPPRPGRRKRRIWPRVPYLGQLAGEARHRRGLKPPLSRDHGVGLDPLTVA
ncbi:MAG TPA: hypothetical protein VIX82_02630, partial [Solirubrobacteraceae bacterium]